LRILDALARIPAGRAVSLTTLLSAPACRQFAGGLRIIVTTDRGLVQTPIPLLRVARQRWVVLQAGAFAGELLIPGGRAPPLRPWIWIDDSTQVPTQLRQGWREIAYDSSGSQ
jgi:hypothetical protein